MSRCNHRTHPDHRNEPRRITTKYAGTDADGHHFAKGDTVTYYPTSREVYIFDFDNTVSNSYPTRLLSERDYEELLVELGEQITARLLDDRNSDFQYGMSLKKDGFRYVFRPDWSCAAECASEVREALVYAYRSNLVGMPDPDQTIMGWIKNTGKALCVSIEGLEPNQNIPKCLKNAGEDYDKLLGDLTALCVSTEGLKP